MATYAERKKKFHIVTIQLDREKDDRLIAWLTQQTNYSETIRQALYERMEGGVNPEAIKAVLDDSLLAHLADVRRVIDNALGSLSLVQAGADPGPIGTDEAVEILASLDAAFDLDD